VRRRLSVLVAATTSAVVLAFLIPLALLLRTLAEDRAISGASLHAQSVLMVAGSLADAADAQPGLQNLINDTRYGQTSLYLPRRGQVLGQDVRDPLVDQIRATRKSLPPQVVDNSAVVYAVSVGSSGVLVARVDIPRDKFHDGVAQATAELAALGMLLLLAAMFAADRLGRRVSLPIRDLAVAAGKMRDGHLDVRIPGRGPPEVVALGTALTQLSTRVQQLLAAERDAVADLSHRLRTPVTALRLDTDSIADPEVAERLRQHVSQLERTVDAIVHDARRPTRAGGNSCDVGRVVSERVAFWSALAEEQARDLQLAVPDRPMRARLDAAELADVIDVLIDNVFAHTDDGVPLSVWVVPRADGAVVLTVEDGGPGLPKADVVSRGSSGAGSTGLGMDIARRAANASGGSLELGRSRLGGALVRVVLGPAD
jgi:signal transduction histidine kinase